MKKLDVVYAGWGQRWRLGTLADDGTHLLYEYSPEALRRGLQLSPLRLPLREAAYSGFPPHLMRLPGLVADALPDGWGLALMDRYFRKHRVDPATLSPLDRLAFLGERALGALVFEPASAAAPPAEQLPLLVLAQEAQVAITAKSAAALEHLALIGGSPHGARPKVLVYVSPGTDVVSTVAVDGAAPWLVKFQAPGEHREVCAIEELYAQLAADCGLPVRPRRRFDLSTTRAAFGMERFDVEGGQRVPVHTLAGLLHADFRVAGSVDYGIFLKATRAFTHDEREVRQAFLRAVFNVAFHNRDDHPKNISYRLGQDGHWRLAPCYDLTYSSGPGGQHQMDVGGEGKDITRAHLLQLAAGGGVPAGVAGEMIDWVVGQAASFKALAAGYPIRVATRNRMAAAVAECVKRLVA